MEKALYIIKPEGMAYRDEIREMMQDAGLKIISFKRVFLKSFGARYDLSRPLIRHFGSHYQILNQIIQRNGHCGSENAIELLRELVGVKTNPDECCPGTIRHRFGVRPGVVVGKSIYYLNIFHRSKTKAEAIRELELYDRIPAIRDEPKPNEVKG